MPIELKMPALSPTMEEGTLAKWLVAVGDTVKSGDVIAEIETDKATMEFEAIDEGTIASIVVAAGTDGVKVGTVIATIAGEGEEAASVTLAKAKAAVVEAAPAPPPPPPVPTPPAPASTEPTPEAKGYGADPVADAPVAAVEAAAREATAPLPDAGGDRVLASPLARRLAAARGIALDTLTGSGPNGRIVKADVEGTQPKAAALAAEPIPSTASAAPTPAPAPFATEIPHEAVKLSNIRKTIARRLTESKQTIPHIYLTVDIRLDTLLKLRGELNAALQPRDIKLSVNDLLIKALAASLIEVPACNVSFTPETLIRYARADISVAVSTPTGLITPIIVDAASKSVSAISTEMKALADKAKAGKLQPHEYQGGTASLSNMGMYGIKAFDAVINPPQAMIMAIGAGEKRPYVIDDALAIATIMSATGSFDHRAIDGADGAQLMQAFKALVEAPLRLVA